ncbi:hypothetical protein [Roseateles sp.]|uniref:hypothetical protein n=1 Tax=Roseateles sp. TaxID=1971397 RepID=UPI00286B7800|nr:hypothetical protein [Roseateles sp.]
MKPNLGAALAEADKSFSKTGNTLEALSWVALAAKTGEPIPPAIGKWLHSAITAYRIDQTPTLDAALGLNDAGAANPKRRLRQDCGLQADLGRMMILHMIGATIPQAAAMAARTSSEMYSASTLEGRFRRSGLGIAARQDRSTALAHWHWTEIETMLAEYPDHGIEIAEGKESIRSMYAKHRI